MKETVLILDPSKTATGWVIWRGDKVVDWGCYQFKSHLDKKAAKIDQYLEFYLAYNNFLHELCRKYWVEVVVSEYPHGTQSYGAATALQIVKDSVSNLLVNLGVKLKFYTEAEAKKTHYGKSKGVEKDQTVIEMSKRFEDAGYAPKGVKYVDQAVCDALLVLNHHLETTKFDYELPVS